MQISGRVPHVGNIFQNITNSRIEKGHTSLGLDADFGVPNVVFSW